MAHHHPLPILISDNRPDNLLQRLQLNAAGAGEYDEDWLQDLLYRHPQSLPIAELNPTFTSLIPICREMQTPAGPIDVLYATREGRIVILEAKLWRNPESRRKVIGQILDYAKELCRWTYENLDSAVRAARRRDEAKARSLVDVVRGKHPDLDEAHFIDAVARNLRRGEFLLLIAGDGIRENVGAIADFIEDHGTLHFTFGLIEMAIYRLPDGGTIVQPRVLAQTNIIKRIVVEARDAVTADADAPEEAEESPGSLPPADLEQQRAQYSEFWKEWLARFPLDDQSQPVKPPTKGTNQFFGLPAGCPGRIAAVAAFKSGSAGVYIYFPRDPIGDRFYATLLEDRSAIDAAIGQPVKWEVTDKWQTVSIWRKFGDGMLTARRGEVQAWLGEVTNSFVNAFRPRIESIARDQGA
jgi:hypothetical protein